MAAGAQATPAFTLLVPSIFICLFVYFRGIV